MPAKVADYLHNPHPDYPILAKHQRQQGVVMLKAIINIAGQVQSLQIYRSSGYEILDQSALKTVKNWRFTVAEKNSKPVQDNIIIPIEFKLF